MIKKNNQNFINEFFLNLAFEQAKINLGSTGSNPSVGCVIVKNNSVISSGYTSLSGRPHAEFNALNKKINYKNSTIYVTLEPCSHYGVTSPCTNIISKKKIKKVFYSLQDIDSRSANKAKKKLKKYNISVTSGIMQKKSKIFYKSYLNKKRNLLPYVDAKLALSKDFFYKNNSSKYITNSISRRVGNFLRTKYDGLLTTSKTINEDNPKLNIRIEGLENKSPSILIVDRNLNLKKKLQIFSIHKTNKIFIFTVSQNIEKINFFKKKKINVIRFKSLITYHDYIKLFQKISKLGFNRIFLESGSTFLNFLTKNEFINNIYLFKSKYEIGKKGIKLSSLNIRKKLKSKKKIKINLTGDSLYKINFK